MPFCSTAPAAAAAPLPRVFVSHKWPADRADHDSHRQTVLTFAREIKAMGFEPVVDYLCQQEIASMGLPAWMGFSIHNAHKIVLLCDAAYKVVADILPGQPGGGVQAEVVEIQKLLYSR